jgi:mannose-6-phosphate isomerase
MIVMAEPALYPLLFAPIFQYRLWGGRRLADWMSASLPGAGPIGEAWVLSDRDDFPSRVAEGPLKGRTIAELMERSAGLILGKSAPRFKRFPLLLKFLDVNQMLSVQVHPPDRKLDLIPKGETGKTEAWVVLEAGAGSRVYAGLKAGATPQDLRELSKRTVDNYLASFSPCRGQAVLIEAGVVHALGDGVVVFEVQENSDVTFRLFDWEHVDPATGRLRPLQVEKALACIDPRQGSVVAVEPVVETTQPVMRERLVDNPHFRLWRLQSVAPFVVGVAEQPRILVCIEGGGNVEFGGADFAMRQGGVLLLSASLGACRFRPDRSVTLLEIAVPELP